MKSATSDERELVRRAGAGDRDAFRALHDAYVRDVYRFLARRAGPHLAEDLTAETFLSAWRALPAYEERGAPVRYWLLRIAHRHLLSWARRRSADELPVADIDGLATDGLAESVVNRVVDQTALRAGLARLTELQRAALELRYLQDLSVTDTAAVLGLAEPATRQLVRRALQAMVRYMEPRG